MPSKSWSCSITSILGAVTALCACDGLPQGESEAPETVEINGAAGALGVAEEVRSSVSECVKFEGSFASEVLDYEFGTGQDYGQEYFPERVFGGPDGRGPGGGSLDVVSLGDGGFVELGFSGRVIVDGPGPDFIVFENSFEIGGEEGRIFYELAQVSVSMDGKTWIDFPCEATAPPAGNCAGWHPVLASVKTGEGDPFDPSISGGDQFDLSDVGLSEARYVRVSDLEGDEDIDGNRAVFDLDAVAVLNGRCE